MKRFSWMLIFVMLLGIWAAPQALAESPKDHHPGVTMSKEDAYRAMEAVMQLRHHPYRLKDMSVEKLTWLLRGLDHLAKMPFVDHSALFDLQLKLSLHLLDIQVKRLQHIYKYSYYPWDYGYMHKYYDWDYGYVHKYYDWDYGYMRKDHDANDGYGAYGKGYEKDDDDYGDKDDDDEDHHGMMGQAGMNKHDDRDDGYYGGYRRHPMMPVKHMHKMRGIRVKKMQFHSAQGCHLHQAKATRMHERNYHIFVGPCQQVGREAWTFNVWWV